MSEKQRQPLSPSSKKYESDIKGMEIKSHHVAYVYEQDLESQNYIYL